MMVCVYRFEELKALIQVLTASDSDFIQYGCWDPDDNSKTSGKQTIADFKKELEGPECLAIYLSEEQKRRHEGEVNQIVKLGRLY